MEMSHGLGKSAYIYMRGWEMRMNEAKTISLELTIMESCIKYIVAEKCLVCMCVGVH